MARTEEGRFDRILKWLGAETAERKRLLGWWGLLGLVNITGFLTLRFFAPSDVSFPGLQILGIGACVEFSGGGSKLIGVLSLGLLLVDLMWIGLSVLLLTSVYRWIAAVAQTVAVAVALSAMLWVGAEIAEAFWLGHGLVVECNADALALSASLKLAGFTYLLAALLCALVVRIRQPA